MVCPTLRLKQNMLIVVLHLICLRMILIYLKAIASAKNNSSRITPQRLNLIVVYPTTKIMACPPPHLLLVLFFSLRLVGGA